MKVNRFIRSVEILVTFSLVITVSSFTFSYSLLTSKTFSNPSESTSSDVVMPTKEEAIDHPYKDIFQENCGTCHRIESKLVGPALSGVDQRRSEEWILGFVKNSSRMIENGDETAIQLYEAFNKTQMPVFDFLSDEDILGIIDFVKQASE